MVTPQPRQTVHSQLPQKQNQQQNSRGGGYDDLLEMQDFDEVSENQMFEGQLQHQYQPEQVEMVSGSQEMALAAGEEDQEEESVYIKDNVIMRRI